MGAPHTPHLGQMAPVVHIGGTAKEALEQQLELVASTLAHALDMLSAAEPHGRDYITLGQMDPAHYNLAVRQHVSRLHRVTSVLEEIQEIQIAVMEQP